MFSEILSFIFMLFLSLCSALNIPLYGYESKELFSDPQFTNGFTVMSQQTQDNAGIPLGNFTYNETDNKPSWTIAQWHSGPCLWENRNVESKYTITDKSTKWITYNPQDHSVSLRLNAANIYNGETATSDAWPHLLIEQSPLCDYFSLSGKDKAFYNCSADHMVLSLDIRISDFKPSTNPDGINATQFLAYFYLKGENNRDFIWFGVNLFDDRGYTDTYWALDNASNCMIYSLSTKDTFGFNSRSLFRNNQPYISDEWTRIELDLTPHIQKAIAQSNESNTFGYETKTSDFYIGGTNIGFEIHGNYDCTVEFRNFQITSYNKK